MHYQEVQEALQFIRSVVDFNPHYGIILGTGLGELVDEIEVAHRISYEDIPHFPESTVESHQGQLIFGYLSGKAVVVMAGRFHYYEGYSMKQVTFPVRVLKMLGIHLLIISNVSGSTNATIEAGDIVIIKDHINLHSENPLRGTNDEKLGPRFPDMLYAYEPALIRKALDIAHQNNIPAHTGVYVGLQGPNLETPAEYRYIHRIGGDVVGMSTIPEVIVARHMGLRVFALSLVSNKCFPIDEIKPTTIESVLALAQKAAPRLRLIVRELLKTQ